MPRSKKQSKETLFIMMNTARLMMQMRLAPHRAM